MRNKFYATLLILLSILTACATPATQPSVDANPASSNPTTVPTLPASDSASTAPPSDTPHVDVLDVTHLTLGDSKISATPQRGYVYSCMTQFNGGSAQGTGAWINGDGTWDLTKKITVDGSVTWPHSFTITLQGNGQRLFSGNDLPDHPTGNYPISSSDDAYQVDRNPNSIQEQSIQFSIPPNPTVAAQANCVGGEVGILLSGVIIFSSFDATGRDAVAHEVQDTCDGHPQESGYYHYHSLSNCIQDTTGHSGLVGYAFDGFGIYGYYGEDGKELTNAELDECHGHTHVVEWDGQLVELYHYHATREFPYVVGCFRGTPFVTGLTSPNGAGNQQPGEQNPQGGNSGQPPQESINACINLTQGAACSFTTPNGQVKGTCNLPPNSSQLACIPAGEPP